MLVSALVDPAAFDERHFQDKHYGSWARQFFKEMTTENGLFLADRDKRLLVQGLRQRFLALNEKHRQQLLLCLAEAIKQKRFHFGDCSDVDTLNICCELIDQYNPDAVIASPENINRFRHLGEADSDTVLSFHEYQDSNFQKARRRYIYEHQDLAQMEATERENIFFRITQFSDHLKIYDKQIGNCSNGPAKYRDNLDRFRKGIEFVLNQWPHSVQKKEGHLEIFTCALHNRKDDKFECEKDIILNRLLKPLRQRRRTIEISLFVKKDSNRSMHARYLQTQNAVFSIERGFDFYDDEENFKLNPISLVMGQGIVDTLQEFRRLDDCIEPLT